MGTVDKAKLRTVYLRKRKMLSDGQHQTLSRKVLLRFIDFIKDQEVNNVHVFLPIEKQRELDTWPITWHLKNQSIPIVVSKSDIDSNQMTHFVLERKDQLELNKWGIPEPYRGKRLHVSEIDMVLVPMVLFDRLGQRIGYGKGYYDRFLNECRPDCVKVGLSLNAPVDFIPYSEVHDVPLDHCITPLKTYQFKNERRK